MKKQYITLDFEDLINEFEPWSYPSVDKLYKFLNDKNKESGGRLIILVKPKHFNNNIPTMCNIKYTSRIFEIANSVILIDGKNSCYLKERSGTIVPLKARIKLLKTKKKYCNFEYNSEVLKFIDMLGDINNV